MIRCKIAQWHIYTIKQSAKGQYFAFFKERKSCPAVRQQESVIFEANLKGGSELQI